MGFVMAGHEIIWANDLYEDATKTYELNLGHHVVYKNIMDISSDEIPDCDIVMGGFPCQGFSVANTKRDEADSRNVLYKELIRVIKAKQPKFFLAENVKGLLSFCKGKVFQMIISDFESMGYRVKNKLFNAANYGVPQKRERVIIVGIRADIGFEFEFPEETHGQYPALGQQPWVTVGDALAELPDPDKLNTLKNHEYSKYKLRFNGYIGNRAIDPNKSAPTVTARGDDKGGVVVLHHPSNTRRMSCRELATVQSFPLDFEFYGNRSSVYRQIGNAVPPLMAKAIAMQFNKFSRRTGNDTR